MTVLEREAVQEAVRHVLLRARRGEGGALFVVGEPGLGKTTILEFARSVATPGVRVGTARGDVMEAGLPFGLIAQAVEALGSEDVLAGAAPLATPDVARTSRFYRTVRWLQDLSSQGPVLLALDDLHWGDADSLALFSYLCRRIDALPVAIIATLRPWPPKAEEVCLRLAAGGAGRVERLSPLTEGATRALLAERIGHPVDDRQAEQTWEATAGNPLLVELVAEAIDLDAVQPAGRQLLLHRFSGLPETGLDLARAASVLGSRFRPDVAIALARLEEHDAVQAMDALTASGFLRPASIGTAEFTHLIFQQALYDDLPPLRREALHARAFGLLEERGLEVEAAEHAVRGNLFGNPDAVDVLVRTGRAALRSGAIATAVERLEAAARLAGTHVAPPLLLLLGEAYLAKGRSVLAGQAFERLLGQPDVAPRTRAEALRLLGRALYMTGDGARGARRFEEATAAAEADDPAAAAQALLDHSRAAWLTAGPVAALPVIDRARRLAGQLDVAMQREVDAARAFVAFAAGDPDGLATALAAAREAPDDESTAVRDLSWGWSTLRNSGRAAKYAEHFAEAEAVFAATFARAEGAGSPTALVSLAAHHADTLARQGRLDGGLAFATRATEAADLAPMAEAFAYAVKALVLLHLDRTAEAETCLDQAERAATIRGQWLPLLRVLHLRALGHFHDGRFAQAGALYVRLADRTEKLGIGEPCLVPWARHAITTHVRLGELAEAERVLTWLAGCAERLPCRWPRIAEAAGRATLAEARDDLIEADTELRQALALHDEVDLPLEHVETLLQYGSLLRRAGRLREARDALREALALSERTGARWLARSVHTELNVAGGRRRRLHASPHGLTAQEQRVAELAAVGRSSAEIARHLSLSVRTIETHLGRIYAKLGIHSQRELMAAAQTRPPWRS